MSKLITYPPFKGCPQTNAANVNENIDNWIKKKDKKSIETFLRKDYGPGTHKGYRFINSEDLIETFRTTQWFKSRPYNVCIEFIFIRYYKAGDRFCPLWFNWDYDTIIMKNKFSDQVEVYKSDAQLKRFIKFISKK